MTAAEDVDDDGVADEAEATTFEVPFSDRGTRLDAWIAQHLEGVSRSRVAQLIEQGHVVVAGVAAKASLKLRGSEKVTVSVPAPAPSALVAQDLPLSFVYDDDDLCVIDKPAGLVVHPGAGHEDGTVANALLFRFPNLSINGERRPGIVHRLDKDTSGLLVVAKNDDAQRGLAEQFHDRRVDKRYVAVCLGAPVSPLDHVTGHRRHSNDRRRYTTKLPAPDEGVGPVKQVRRAHSRFTVRAEADGAAVVDVELLTGRTHQIRAHLADLGHPLLQDELYGGAHAEKRLKPGPVRDATLALKRQALHAFSIEFAHPRSSKRIRLESPLPPDLRAVVDAIMNR